MIFLCLGVDQNVIKEYQDKIIQFFSKEIFHKAIEGGRDVCEAKEHDSEFVIPKSGVYRCFKDVFFSDLDLVVS